MITLIKCELKKLKGRYFFVMSAVFIMLYLAWVMHGYDKPSEADLKFGWKLLLYQLPLINTILLPFICSVTASRLCETEHSGNMLKQLCTLTSRGRLFDAKLFLGILSVGISVAVMWVCIVMLGFIKGFWGKFPVDLYIKYLIFTLLPTFEIYILQHSLALCFKNQSVGFFTGIAGEFAGVFSIFLQNVPWLRKLLIWGHYGALDLMGMYGWTKETKFENVYFVTYDISPIFIIFIIASTVLIYLFGRYMFERKEL